VTDEALITPATTISEKYTVVLPETMHETSLSDSEDEGLSMKLFMSVNTFFIFVCVYSYNVV